VIVAGGSAEHASSWRPHAAAPRVARRAKRGGLPSRVRPRFRFTQATPDTLRHPISAWLRHA
jgi:hypothetical protein